MIDEFNRLVAQWKRETGHLSSVTDIEAHPACRQIVAMGKRVVPLILRDMERCMEGNEVGGWWFGALCKLTGANPVPPEDAGRVRKMEEAWLQWGRDQGII